jgi:hypothetical protein
MFPSLKIRQRNPAAVNKMSPALTGAFVGYSSCRSAAVEKTLFWYYTIFKPLSFTQFGICLKSFIQMRFIFPSTKYCLDQRRKPHRSGHRRERQKSIFLDIFAAKVTHYSSAQCFLPRSYYDYMQAVHHAIRIYWSSLDIAIEWTLGATLRTSNPFVAGLWT